MESVVNQAFCHVFLADSAGFLEWSQVDDAFMCNATVAARVEDWKCAGKTIGDVVGGKVEPPTSPKISYKNQRGFALLVRRGSLYT